MIYLKSWYNSEYPSDEMGRGLRKRLSLEAIYENLGKVDIYDMIDVVDSLIRERIFVKIAEIKGVDYDHVYRKWLNQD